MIKDFPKKIYCIGDIKLLNHNRIIGIVGSRNCTKAGEKYTKMFSKELSNQDICIISGLAIGTDTAAHIGAVCERGKTIAVLAGGLNNIYPKENISLFHMIINNGGCIISEHEDDMQIEKKYFLDRNRIISGMSDAIIVSECRKRSGSISTANNAFLQNKKVYCIEHEMDKELIEGKKWLVKKGAIEVKSPNKIIEEVYNY